MSNGSDGRLKTCKEPDCLNRANGAYGWCSKHYKRWRLYGDVEVVLNNRGLPISERFLMKTLRVSSGCLEWQAAKQKDGYGIFGDGDGGCVLAHRWAWENEHGPIPEGKEIDHLCRNRACVEVSHLEPVTHAENVRRGKRPPKTHCPHGHPYIEENIYWAFRDGKWIKYCLICRKRAQRATKEKRRDRNRVRV